MTPYIIGLLLGMFLGAYLGNKAFREKVKQEGIKLAKEIDKLAGTSNTKKKEKK